MSLPYFKFHPSDDLGNYKLMTLSHEMLGVWYLLRICQLWPHQGMIPDDTAYIAPLLRLSNEAWENCRTEFLKRGLIQTIDGCITIAYLRDQWVKAQTYSEVQRAKQLEVEQKKRETKVLKKKAKPKT